MVGKSEARENNKIEDLPQEEEELSPDEAESVKGGVLLQSSLERSFNHSATLAPGFPTSEGAVGATVTYGALRKDR